MKRKFLYVFQHTQIEVSGWADQEEATGEGSITLIMTLEALDCVSRSGLAGKSQGSFTSG